MPPGASSATSKAPGSATRTRPCIVLVDDEAAYVDLLEQLMVEHVKCPVVSFTDPRKALKGLRGRKVAMVVTDFNMPGMDGLEFIAAAQKLLPGIPVIMITAYPVEFTSEQRQKVPALKAVVRKPFPWSALAAQITRHWPANSGSPFAAD
jgi:DNA-binding NtrC family response regulator